MKINTQLTKTTEIFRRSKHITRGLKYMIYRDLLAIIPKHEP